MTVRTNSAIKAWMKQHPRELDEAYFEVHGTPEPRPPEPEAPLPSIVGLTKRQGEALIFIHGFIAKTNRSPTFVQIAEGLGLSSKSGVHRLVKALEFHRRIRRSPKKACSITIVEARP